MPDVLRGPQEIRAKGWRQGSILPSTLNDSCASRFEDWTNDDLAMVVSQDCDVVNASYEHEPTVEIIRLRQSSTQDNLIRHARNPRKIQVVSTDGKIFDASVHERRTIPRSDLELHGPQIAITFAEETVRLVAEWIAKRYTRPAFPDAFNERIRESSGKIEKELKKNGELITGLFLAVTPDTECTEEQSYTVLLRVTAAHETLKSVANEQSLVKTEQRIAEALSTCPGIELKDHALVSEASFSLDDLHYFRRWDWDYRSHAGTPGGELAPVP